MRVAQETAPGGHVPGRWSTGEEVVAGLDLRGRRALVTGASCGLGYETARCLALAGAEVTVATRSPGRGTEAARAIAVQTGNPRVVAARLDLADLECVGAFVAGWRGPLDVLVANAGVMALPELRLTPQGFEEQFATNFLGHHALAVGLHRALAAAGGSRLVSVSSAAHRASEVVLDDVSFTRRPYDPFSAYGQSKSAAALLAVHAATAWADDGVEAYSLHPGAVWTRLQRHTGTMRTPVELRKTVAQGAATSLFLAAAPQPAAVSGRYFEDCRVSPVCPEAPGYHDPGVMHWAADPERAERLWNLARHWSAAWVAMRR